MPYTVTLYSTEALSPVRPVSEGEFESLPAAAAHVASRADARKAWRVSERFGYVNIECDTHGFQIEEVEDVDAPEPCYTSSDESYANMRALYGE